MPLSQLTALSILQDRGRVFHVLIVDMTFVAQRRLGNCSNHVEHYVLILVAGARTACITVTRR